MITAIAQPKPLTFQERTQLESVEGVVFDIQRYSVHDGPGLRTNVFLKGCPLRCQWCANPESLNAQPELVLFANRCMACGQFPETCPAIWESRHTGKGQQAEQMFGERVSVCPTKAIRWSGERRAAGDVIKEVLRDAPFYKDGGGMTLTGGEPTMQPQFAEALLRLAKAESISTAMETCGHTDWSILERLLPYLNHILFDLKHIDPEAHRRFTRVGNEDILANLRQLAALNAPLTIRVPLIPGFNATPESLQAIAGFVLELNGSITHIDLLPYHTLGTSKYEALGRDYPWRSHERLQEAAVNTLADVIRACGLTVNIGG